MSKELDIAVARAMGYRVVKDAVNVRGCQIGTAGRRGHDLPYYSEDAALIPMLLKWIEAHALCVVYLAALRKITHDGDVMDWWQDWKFITATPEQHCKALIACTQAP